MSAAPPDAPERPGTAAADDLGLLPPALAARWDGLKARWTSVDTVATIMIVAQLPVLAWLLVPGSHYVDDFRGQSYAAGESWWPFVVHSNGTHLSVVARTLDLLQVRFAPLDHTVTVLITVGLRVAFGIAVWKLLRLLFGPLHLTLVPLGVLLASPALVPPTAWYRQTMVLLPILIAIAVATDQHVRWMAWGRRRHLAGAVAGLVLGLLSFEKAVSMTPYLAAVTVALFVGRFRETAGRVWRRGLVAVGCYTALTVVYLVYYFSGQFDTGTGHRPGPLAVLRLTGVTLFEGLIPALFGGPWEWSDHTEYYGIAATPSALSWLAVTAVLLALTLVIRRRFSRVWRGALVAFGYLLPLTYLIAVGRYVRVGQIVAQDYRFWVDAMLPLVLGLSIAFLPVRVGLLAKPMRGRARPRPAGHLRPLIGAVAILAVLGASLSTLAFGTEWHRNPADDWVQRAIHSIQARQAPSGTVALYDTSVPAFVVPYWVQPDYSLEDLLAPVTAHGDVAASFNLADGPAYVIDSTGALRTPTLAKVAVNMKPPLHGCGFPFVPGQESPTTIPFSETAAYYRDNTLRLGALVGGRTSLQIALVTEDGTTLRLRSREPLVLDRGPHTIQFRIPDRVRVTGVQVRPIAQVGLCIMSASVVVPQVGRS
jgi:hypothetical protein